MQLNRMEVINAVVDAITQVGPGDVQVHLSVALMRSLAGMLCA